MKSFLGLTPLIEHVYSEVLPSEDAMFKEADKQAQATLNRIQDLKFRALMRGKVILGQSRTRQGFEIFTQPEIEPKKDLPRLKINELVPLELKSENHRQ
jgi:hypothetical protein